MQVTRGRAGSLLAGTLLAAAFTRPVQAQDMPLVRVGTSLSDDLTPALYAVRTGMFAKAGLNVDFKLAGSGTALAAAVAGGSLDIGKSTLTALISAHAHGVHFKIVAPSGVFDASSPTGNVVVLRDSPIKTLADFNGKTIATLSLKSLDTIAISAFVDQHGGNSATLKFTELGYSAMQPALEAGSIDIASIAQPTLQTVLESGKVRSLGEPYDALGKRYLIAAWFSTREYAAQNPTIVARFNQVISQAAAYTNAHPADTVAMVADFMKVDPERLKNMHRLASATAVDPHEVQLLIDASAKYKLIEQTFPASELL